MLSHINIPKTEIIVLQRDIRSIYIVRKLFFYIVFYRSVLRLKYNLRHPVDTLYSTAHGRLIHTRVATVEDDQISHLELRHHHRFHVVYIHIEGLCIYRGEALDDNPVFRKNLIYDVIEIPHTVDLDDHAIRTVFFQVMIADILGELFLVFHSDHIDLVTCQKHVVKLNFTLLSEDQKRSLSVSKVTFLDNLTYTRSLSAFQKTHKKVYGNILVTKHIE